MNSVVMFSNSLHRISIWYVAHSLLAILILMKGSQCACHNTDTNVHPPPHPSRMWRDSFALFNIAYTWVASTGLVEGWSAIIVNTWIPLFPWLWVWSDICTALCWLSVWPITRGSQSPSPLTFVTQKIFIFPAVHNGSHSSTQGSEKQHLLSAVLRCGAVGLRLGDVGRAWYQPTDLKGGGVSFPLFSKG